MNLDSLSFALSQISYSVANLTKKNYKSSVAEISHLVSQHGAEADRHLFRCLFSHVDFSGDGKTSGKDFHQTQYLIAECGSILQRPNVVSTLCYAIDNPLHHQKSLKPSPQLFPQLSRLLKLSPVQEVVFGIALLHSSNPDTRGHAANFVRQKLPQLLNAYIDAESGSGGEGSSLKDTPVEVLHLFLTRLISQTKDNSLVTQEQKDGFLAALKRDFPEGQAPAVLAPLLYREIQDYPATGLLPHVLAMPKNMMESSLADMMHEAGYGCTSSHDECQNTLMQFGVRELTAPSIARVLSMMCRTPAGLGDPIQVQGMPGGSLWSDGKEKPDTAGATGWNVDIFVQVVKELAPHLNWRDVVPELDHPGFVVPSTAGLRVLIQALSRGIQDVFPIEVLYQQWKNTEGQLSWITQALKHPEVFCLADFIVHTVVTDLLKTPPDEDNRDIATWKSLQLVETLLRLSEAGHFQQVSELFKLPMQLCPDLLVLALLQIPTWNTLKQELLAGLIPIFLNNHPNSGIILPYAWHCQGQSTTIRTLVMHAMAEWYMREHNDQTTRLSRILDVAQDLKALSMLLNATPFAFVIDLACLASRREYLKLDKWLSDKIREHGEPFLQASVSFLKRRCPQFPGSGMKEEHSKSQPLPPDTVATMLTCLQAYVGNVSQELSETIMTMVMMKPRISQPAGVGTKPALPQVSAMPGLPPATANAASEAHAQSVKYAGFPQLDGMGSMGAAVGMGVAGMNVASATSASNTVFPASLAGLSTTPGSPAKAFAAIGPPSSVAQQQQPFNSMPGLASQLQGTPYNDVSLGAPPGSPAKFAAIGPPTSSQGQPFTPMRGLTNQPTQIPGSPAKFPPVGPTEGLGQSFNPMQGLATQFQGLNLQSAMGGSSGGIRTPTLTGLSTNVMKPAEGLSLPPPTSQAGDASSIFPHGSQQFSKEIEDEANSYFQRIYNHPPHPTISIDAVLDMLKKFKESPSKKEKEVFACMLRNLFEEYRFFPQYPDKELHTTAVLFGGIIEQGLVTYMDLGIALRYVLEALKKPNSSKMYHFGIAALDRFRARLKDYPQYCQHLASIPHFSQFPEHLMEFVEYGSRSQVPPNMPQGPSSTLSMTPVSGAATTVANTSGATTTTTATASSKPVPSTGMASKPSIANATNIDTLLAGTEDKEDISVPPEAVQDKVFFIFNNLSLANMEQKAQELKEYVTDDYTPWVSQYLVMKRASIEPNFHTLYANFIDHLKKQDVLPMVINETYRNIKVLLRSDKGVANFSDRSLLKNLGHWLGMLTLAKNKPILHVDIDLKSLLYEAYYKGAQELLYVVPFVAKVIESCSKSKVFCPPNPWTMGLMNVLAELHTEPDLKLNLKFEIEVLCKTLNIDIQNDLKAANYLKAPERLTVLENQLSAPKLHEPPSVTPPQAEESLILVQPTPSVVPTPPATVPTSTPSVSTPPQPQFNYHDINVLSLTGLGQHLALNDQLGLFQAHPQLKQFVRGAIELAVQDLLPPVVERSIKIALTTCEQIVKKDFALDPDENHLRAAAHQMVRNMTAGMALITCREPLLIAINTNIKKAFMTSLRGATQPQKELMDQAAQVLAQDNTELACAFIQKTAVEKALPEIDKKLLSEFELRKAARQEGRRYCDPVVLTYQAERMPEQIRLKVGGVTPQQIAVYEEFARNIPGFQPTTHEAQQQTYLSKQINVSSLKGALADQAPYMADDITVIYDKILLEMEQHLHAILAPPNTPQVAQMHSLREALLRARSSPDLIYANSLLQKAVEGLLDGLTAIPNDAELMFRFRDCHLLVLRGLQDNRAYGPQWTNKQVTRWLMECREDYRYNVEAVEVLIRAHLVHVQQYDLHLASAMENGLNYTAAAFAMQLLQRFSMDEKQGQDVMEFSTSIEMLARIAAHSRQAPEGLTTLIETIRQRTDSGLLERAPSGPTSMMHSGISQAREFDDPPGLHEKTEYLLREWVNMYHSPQAGRDSTKAFSSFVGQMHSQGILKTDELITRFFRLCTEMCVDLCYRALSEHPHSPTLVRAKCFHTLDAFVRLIALLVKHSGDTANTVTKINLLNKVLGIVAGVLLQDHEVRGTEFQQLPYHRIFIMLFIELNAPEQVLESINFQVLTAFCNTYHILRPAKAPGFAYAWLELVSHRVFIGRMLAITPQQKISPLEDRKGWNMYAQLLIDLFKFLAPFLRNAELSKPTQLLYKGTLRVLLVLLHDFPELLCDYHYAFCDVIPPNCIQMRNLILSAFPRNMRLPDPFTPNLKVDILGEIQQPPRIMTNFASLIHPPTFKKDLDSYLKTRSPVTFLSELRSNLQVSNEPGMRYDIQLINALVLYVGNQAISYIHAKNQTPSMSTIAHSSHMDIFQNLAVDLDTEGRYLFLNAIANQLRYPNSHTHYFSCSMLYLFAEANAESIQEQITRVLLERLIVNRPHPWGLLITFIELIKNPQFKFWSHEFVHCAQEIEKLFESVARSCMHPRQTQNMREQEVAETH